MVGKTGKNKKDEEGLLVMFVCLYVLGFVQNCDRNHQKSVEFATTKKKMQVNAARSEKKRRCKSPVKAKRKGFFSWRDHIEPTVQN